MCMNFQINDQTRNNLRLVVKFNQGENSTFYVNIFYDPLNPRSVTEYVCGESGYYPKGFNLTVDIMGYENVEQTIYIERLIVNLTKTCPLFSYQDKKHPLQICRCIRNYWQYNSTIIDNKTCLNKLICFTCKKCWDNLCDKCIDSQNGTCLTCNKTMEPLITLVDGFCICPQGFYRTSDDSKIYI
jgi:hypothetical protein